MNLGKWKKLIGIWVVLTCAGTAFAWPAEQSAPSFLEKEGSPQAIKKNKFPWLLTILGAAAVGTAVYALTKKGTSTPPAGPGAPDTPTLPDFEELVRQFDYDAQLPLNIQETQTDERGAIRIHHLTFADPKGGRVPSLLVMPPGPGPFAAVLFLHSGQSDIFEFLEEAVSIADRGAVSLLVTIPRYSESLDAHYVRTVVDLRRAVDLLLGRNDVEPGRLGYVGHSFGATWGGVLAGVEKRLKAYVLMAGYGRDANIPEKLSPCHYIGHAAPAALLFQFALNDEFISIAAANDYFQAASEPKAILWYDTTHALNAQAQFDRVNWLGMQLGLY